MASFHFPGTRFLSRACCVAALGLVGCSGREDWQVETQPVRGAVLINGEVPENAVLTLYPQGGPIDVRKSKPWGKVDADGTFVLQTYEQGDGAPPGTYDVTLVWRKDPSVLGSPDQLGGAYDEVRESQWTVAVEAGREELDPLRIDGVKIVTKPGRPQAPPDEPTR
ncbi:hypothetical protein [Alienimonas californiensis]|uniref:Carboxypeptidase regulatory-like domain-containing protein n=1 Tax=Alienimonas californiensis TaxID=2527989 RepID=A0A517P3X0_9PLAN|nr:hypothetical protein [Alienimonas californiensis]QDT14084.1 hypothetical protein CA12_01520 [Alienimonas californiensis]